MMFRQWTGAVVLLAVAGGAASAAGDSPPPAPPGAKTVSTAHPGLASGGLMHAKLADLPKDTLLRAGTLVLKESDLAAEIAAAPEAVREQLRKNAFFVLEQVATRRLLVAEAKAAARQGKDAAKADERELLDGYMNGIAAEAKVADAEIADFYTKSKDQVGDAKLEAVKEAIRRYLLQQKRQQAVDEHIRSLGKRANAEVSADWTKQQAAAAADNPVDKARASGKPSLVDFGSKGCRPCDMLAPILDALRGKYAGRANVVFVSVREEQVLASRYGIQAIPEQVFFDKDGKEVFRHTGFWPQEKLEKKLAEMGVK